MRHFSFITSLFYSVISASVLTVVTATAHAQSQADDALCRRIKEKGACNANNKCVFSLNNECFGRPTDNGQKSPPQPTPTPTPPQKSAPNFDAELQAFTKKVMAAEASSKQRNEQDKEQQFAAIRKRGGPKDSINRSLVAVQEQTNRTKTNIEQLSTAKLTCAQHHHKLRPFRGLDHCEINYEPNRWFR